MGYLVKRRLSGFACTAGAVLVAGIAANQADTPAKDYWVKLVCESSDRIATVHFGPKGASLEKITETRILQSDMSGPHGIAFSPDRKNFYVSIGHGRPFGTALKYTSEGDKVVGQVGLGLFPATEDVSPDGNFLYVVNFNLHGDMVPSSVSVVATDPMLEIARIPTCVMPHGSRVTRDGTRQYSGCMMDDLLVEIDAEQMKLTRTFELTAGKERGYNGLPPKASAMANHADHAGMERRRTLPVATCQPTWAQPSVTGKRVFVACNKSSEIVEVDTETWSLVRRIPAGNGVYNLGVTPDGKLLLATNKRDASVSIFDITTATELARLPTTRKVVHGVTVSPDSRYAFFTVEGIGEQPGTVEIVDLESRKIVASVDTPPQAAGIDFWKME
jgi:DNA-binding beta-propeller fold protein YncE